MERSKLAIALILIVIAGILVAIVFNVNLPGIARYSHSLGQYPPEDDATLWEKAAWEKNHGSVPQCGFFADSQGPVVLYPSSFITISNLSFRFSLAPGEPVHEISNITYTLSNRYAMKTVRAGDPGVRVTCQKKILLPGMLPGDLNNSVLEGDEIATVELDMEKMGPGTPVLGPNQKFVVDIVPADNCSRDFIILGTTPLAFLPGTPIELSGRL
ncbi:MAG: hypothetical protein LUQ66_09750 [Methanoregula sp.]|nr:hypothetical protein [Methanoregula sp.]